MQATILFTHALTSLHPGTGQGVGVIDLPVAREVATSIPYLPGSSLKGVLRDRCTDAAVRKKLFGPETSSITDSNAHAGAAVFTDQKLLLLPVRSLGGTFAWVTSPYVLHRLQRDCASLPISPPDAMIPTGGSELKKARVPGVSVLSIDVPNGPNQTKKQIFLEDLDLEFSAVTSAREWADWLKVRIFPGDAQWQALFAQHFCIVHDDIFTFLLDTATEVTARNVLSDKKTSENLWYVEALPAESILYGLVAAQQIGANGTSPTQILTEVGQLLDGTVQLGGMASVGYGLCRLLMEMPPSTQMPVNASAVGGNNDN